MKLDILDKCIIIAGKRGSGKTVVMTHIVKRNVAKFNAVFVVCPSDPTHGTWTKLIDKRNIKEEWNEEWAEKFLDSMAKANVGKDRFSPEFKRVLLILDDCVAERGFATSKVLNKIFIRGRHLGITIICSCQTLFSGANGGGLPPSCRTNADILFIGGQNRQSYELLAKENRIGFNNKREFIDIMEERCRDYGFVVIDMNSKTSDIEDTYFFFKVPQI